MTLWFCRVCGLDYDESPWGADGQQPDFSTCGCCGVTFGFDDATPAAARQFRAQWLAAGAAWFYPRQRPAGWEPAPQLTQLDPLYR